MPSNLKGFNGLGKLLTYCVELQVWKDQMRIGSNEQNKIPGLSTFANRLQTRYKKHCKEVIDIKQLLRFAKTRKNTLLANMEAMENFKVRLDFKKFKKSLSLNN